jgi:hypothetical protein
VRRSSAFEVLDSCHPSLSEKQFSPYHGPHTFVSCLHGRGGTIRKANESLATKADLSSEAMGDLGLSCCSSSKQQLSMPRIMLSTILHWPGGIDYSEVRIASAIVIYEEEAEVDLGHTSVFCRHPSNQLIKLYIYSTSSS